MTSTIPTPAPKRSSLLGPLLASLASLALVIDQLRLAHVAHSFEVVHLLSVPPLWVWVPLGILALAAGVIALVGPARFGEPRLIRVPLLVLVLIAFIDGLMLGDVRPLPRQLDGEGALMLFGQSATNAGEELGHLPTTIAELESAMRDNPGPPFLIHGERPAKWKVVVRTGCQGPASQVSGVAPGTFIYCVAEGNVRAWITAVGHTSSLSGPPEILSYAGRPMSHVVESPNASAQTAN